MVLDFSVIKIFLQVVLYVLAWVTVRVTAEKVEPIGSDSQCYRMLLPPRVLKGMCALHSLTYADMGQHAPSLTSHHVVNQHAHPTVLCPGCVSYLNWLYVMCREKQQAQFTRIGKRKLPLERKFLFSCTPDAQSTDFLSRIVSDWIFILDMICGALKSRS